jgi:hypothetical protein
MGNPSRGSYLIFEREDNHFISENTYPIDTLFMILVLSLAPWAVWKEFL